MIDPRILHRLQEEGVASCLIGAAALAVHGHPRYSADVDLLVADRRVLSAEFWSGCGDPEIRPGSAGDPLLGVVRWDRPEPVDLVVNDDYASRYALRTAAAAVGVPTRVATPTALVLLKLEAGGPLDAHDIVALVQVQRALNGAPWLAELPSEVRHLRHDARALWKRLAASLEPQPPKA